jgi:lipopolysaccharide exporter
VNFSSFPLTPATARKRFGFPLPKLGASQISAVWLFTGTLASQFLTFAFAPILTRLYTPHEMGFYSVFISWLAIITVVSTLRFDLAIPVAKDDNDAAGLRALAIGALLVSTFVCAAILFTKWMLVAPGNNIFRDYLIFLPAALLAGGLLQIYIFVATRQKQFSHISRSRLCGGLVTGLTQIVGGIAKPGVQGLFLGVVLGSAVGVGLVGRKLRRSGAAAISVPLKSLRTIASAYRSYPQYSIWGGLLNITSVHVPVFILSQSFGMAITGQYGLSSRFVFLPLTLVASAVSQVFLANAAAAEKSGSLRRQVEKIFVLLNGFAVILIIPAGILAPEAFQLIFGKQWALAGEFALLLTPWSVLVLTGAPLSNVSLVLHRQKSELLFQLILFFVRCSTLLIGAKFFDANTAITIFALTSAGVWIGYHLWIFSIVQLSWVTLPKAFLKSAAFALPVIAVALVFKITFASGLIGWSWLFACIMPLVAGALFLLFARTSGTFEFR